MPQPAVKFDAEQLAPPRRPARTASPAEPVIVTLGEGDVAWAASPARQLHDRLLESFSTPAPRPMAVLSRRQRLLILAGSVIFLWSLIGAATVALIA